MYRRRRGTNKKSLFSNVEFCTGLVGGLADRGGSSARGSSGGDCLHLHDLLSCGILHQHLAGLQRHSG